MSVSLPASVTMQCASAVLADLQTQLRTAPGPLVRLDASSVTELDTSCIAVLLQCQRQVQARGLRLAVDGAPPQLAALMTLYGVAELFGLAPDQAAPVPASA